MNFAFDKAKWLKLAALILLCVAIVLLISGMWVAKQTPPKRTEAAAPAKLFDAWVVTGDLAKGTLLTRDVIKPVTTAQFNDSFIQNADLAIGRRLTRNTLAGAYLTEKMLAPGRPVIDNLPENYRAIAIKAGEVLTVGGYLQPGDHVDVMLLLKPNKESGAITSARKIASDLMVLAIGGQQSDSERFEREDHAKSVVLSVHETLAPVLLLADATGELRLAAVGSKEIATQGEHESPFSVASALFQTVSASENADLTPPPAINTVVELKRFNTTSHAHPKPKRSAATAKNHYPPVSYVEVIQGGKRSIVQTSN